ncbi:MAG TPA: type II toxin-antitoxin system death-on-curing family toxin, partial [Balneola sp.]|nr:type II toxin-antitoxin system death-on-curing family toxin [Balneola sp.]
LLGLYGMAAAYVSCFVFRLPFVDGNKRTALASCLTFLYLNGFEVNEEHDEELADLVVDLVTKKIDTDFLSDFLRTRSLPIS